MANFTVISYYTNDWKYKYYAGKLIDDCKRLKIPHIIKEVRGRRNYLDNCKLKPKFIKNCLKDVKSTVVWVDVDGSIIQYPLFFDSLAERGGEIDFGAKRMKKERDRTWHVGTFLANYTPNAIRFLNQWISLTPESISDEEALDKAYNAGKVKGIKFHDLPKEYFVILKELNHRPPENAIICHRLSEGKSKKEFKQKMRRTKSKKEFKQKMRRTKRER